jgi:hypothetical protein
MNTNQVDATILEVGVGGTYDCTNIVPRPIVTGISSLGIDHVGVLGKTVGEIAWQKGGIFKVGVLVTQQRACGTTIYSGRRPSNNREPTARGDGCLTAKECGTQGSNVVLNRDQDSNTWNRRRSSSSYLLSPSYLRFDSVNRGITSLVTFQSDNMMQV